MKNLEDYIVSVLDFPKPGIVFRDITGILDSPEGLHLAIESLYKELENVEFDVVAGLEARGFLFGVSLAEHFHKSFVPIRKKGKLPRETVSATYELEYGNATIEMHRDAIRPGQKVVLFDDLLATGGTMNAAASLVETVGGTVAKTLFIVELFDLGGRQKLSKYDVTSLVKLPGH